MQVVFQMDDPATFRFAGDSTYALLLEGAKRGHTLFYYQPHELSLTEGHPTAKVSKIHVESSDKNYRTDEAYYTQLSEFDVLFMRQDPPFDLNYITCTHILEQLGDTTFVLNSPSGVRNSPEKLLVTKFRHLTPPTLITRSTSAAAHFRSLHGDIVVKPLFGNGGEGVFFLRKDDQNFAALIETFQKMSRDQFVIQKYLPEVRAGDKRVILVDGFPVGAINRVPADGEARSNMHVGGRAEPVTLTIRDMEICEAIGPELRNRGLVFAGIDIIGNYLTEINVTSPTGLREIMNFTGVNIAEKIWDIAEARAPKKK